MRTLACSIVLVLACAAAANASTNYTSKAGGFEMTVPAAPAESTKDAMSPLGKMKMHIYGGTLSLSTAYTVIHTDLPPAVLVLGKPDDLLDGTSKGIASGTKGKVISTTKIALGTSPGREIVAELPGGTSVVRVRVYLHKGKMYQAMVITAKGSENSNEANAFFASFKLK